MTTTSYDQPRPMTTVADDQRDALPDCDNTNCSDGKAIAVEFKNRVEIQCDKCGQVTLIAPKPDPWPPVGP